MLTLTACRLCFAENPGQLSEDLRFQKEDQEHLYYLGVGETQNSLTECLDLAYQSAIEDAIKENFGIVAKVSSSGSATESSFVNVKTLSQRSKNVRLVGFEKVDTRTKRYSGSTRCFVLYRYSKGAILKEKHRLSDNHSEGPDLLLPTMIGEIDTKQFGSLIVQTSPPGASIWINGAKLLKSPVHLKSQLDAGSYILKIDHPLYKTETRSIEIRPGQTEQLNIILQPATGTLSIDSNFDGAEVKVNYRVVGKTPLTLELPIRQLYEVTVSANEAYPLTLKGIELSKDRTFHETFQLKPKEGTLRFLGLDQNMKVFINGEEQMISNSQLNLPHGSHLIRIEKNDELYAQYSFHIKAHRELTLQIEDSDFHEIRRPSRTAEFSLSNKHHEASTMDDFTYFGVGAGFWGAPISHLSSGAIPFSFDLILAPEIPVALCLSLHQSVGMSSPSVFLEGTEVTDFSGSKFGIYARLMSDSSKEYLLGYEIDSLAYTYEKSTSSFSTLSGSANATGSGIAITKLSTSSDFGTTLMKLAFMNYKTNGPDVSGQSSLQLVLGWGAK
jgi:hypothetical protein